MNKGADKTKKKNFSYPLSSEPHELWIKSVSRQFCHCVDPSQIYWPISHLSTNTAFLYTSPPTQASRDEKIGEEFVLTQKDHAAPIFPYDEVSDSTRTVQVSPWFPEQVATLTSREYYACHALKAITSGNRELFLRYVVYDGQRFDHRSRQSFDDGGSQLEPLYIFKNVGLLFPFKLNKDINGGIDPDTGRPIPHGSTEPVSAVLHAQRPPSLVYKIRVTSDHSGDEDSGGIGLFQAQEAVVHQVPASCIEAVQNAIRREWVGEDFAPFMPIVSIDPHNYKLMDPMAELTRDREANEASEEELFQHFLPACCLSYKKDAGRLVQAGLQRVPRYQPDLPIFGGVPAPEKGSEDARKLEVFLACLADPNKDPSNYKPRKRPAELALIDAEKDSKIESLQLEIEKLKQDASDDVLEIERLAKSCDDLKQTIKKMEEAETVRVKTGQKVVLASGCFIAAPEQRDVIVLNQSGGIVKLSCPAEVVIPSPLPKAW